MTTNEIKELFSNNVPSKKKLSMADSCMIMSYVPVELSMDRKSLEYLYIISINDLKERNVPMNVLEKLRDDGWSISENGNELIIFI